MDFEMHDLPEVQKNSRIAQKTPQVPAVPVTAECWEAVMIDLEGPSTPADKSGNIYVMTYICVVCYGVLLEEPTACNRHEARRMFANCMFRSGRVPRMIRSDRGPEFKNAICKSILHLWAWDAD